jgi:hypothetical protein
VDEPNDRHCLFSCAIFNDAGPTALVAAAVQHSDPLRENASSIDRSRDRPSRRLQRKNAS